MNAYRLLCLFAISLVFLWCGQIPPAQAVEADGYTFLWWADGWRARSEDGRRRLHIQTSRYGLALDVELPDITRLGGIRDAGPYGQAVREPNQVIEQLPAPELERIDGATCGLA